MADSMQSQPCTGAPMGAPDGGDVVSPMRTLWLTFQEARPTVQLAYALRFTVGLRLAGPVHLSEWQAGSAFLSWTSVCVAVYALNGISDRVGDRRNHSSRPIASGALPVPAAWRAVCCLTVTGLVTANAVGPALTVAFALMLLVGWAYSFGARPLKNTVPGLLFSGIALGALTYLAGWIGAGGGVPTFGAAVRCGGMALWMGIVGTMTKDLGDVSGDRLAGRRTLPILVGVRRARHIAAAVALCYATSFLAVTARFTPGHLAAPMVLLAGAVGVAVLPARPGRSARNAYRAFMIAQYGGNLVMLG